MAVTPATPDTSLGRRLLRAPLAWAALCVLVALFAGRAGMGFFPFLCMLIAGLLSGTAFVIATLRMSPAWLGVVVHVAGAVLGGGLLWAGIVGYLPDLSALPEPLRRGIYWLQLGIGPMVGWIWLALMGRVTSRFDGQARDRAAQLTRLAWTREGRGWALHFAAVPLRMRSLTWAIVAVTVAACILSGTAMVVFYDTVLRIGAFGAILVFALVVGLPGYLALTVLLRRRTEAITLRIDGDRLELSRPAHPPRVIALRELTLLRWQAVSDYARLELAAPGIEPLSLLAGVARVPRGTAAELPALPAPMVAWLEAAGLSEMPVRVQARPRTFRRS